MSSARREALLSKVLKKLYPNPANLQTEPSTNQTLPSRVEEKPKETVQHQISQPAGVDKSKISELKVYTVSLPPDDYVLPPQTDLKASSTEDSNFEEDQPVEFRKRRRRKKKKISIDVSTCDGEQNIQQTPQTLEDVKINKNKKRKLQRKRQKERLKAEGLWPKGRTCQTDACQTKESTKEQPDELVEEDQKKKREDLLDFLQATQELYFSDGKSRCIDPDPMVEQILEILDQIKCGAVPFSEVQLLHHLKSVLLLQDNERLQNSLISFKEQSSLPFDHVRAICSLFDYWITNILPIKRTNPTK